MFKKDRENEDDVNDTKKEVTAYEDSWYRSLKALADMRPAETEDMPAPPADNGATRPSEDDEATGVLED